MGNFAASPSLEDDRNHVVHYAQEKIKKEKQEQLAQARRLSKKNLLNNIKNQSFPVTRKFMADPKLKSFNHPVPHNQLSLILTFVPPRHLTPLLRVCRFWNHVLLSNEFWRTYYNLVFPFDTKVRRETWLKEELEQQVDDDEKETNYRRKFIIDFIKAQSSEIEQTKVYLDKKIKMVMIGGVASGKSSVLLRLTKDQFDPSMHDSTIGAAFTTLSLDIPLEFLDVTQPQLNFDVWDSGGQKRFEGVLAMYYRSATLILLVYAIDDSDTFEKAKSWFHTINRDWQTVWGKHPLFVMWGNKNDLLDNRKVKTIDALEFCKKRGIPFREISCKDERREMISKYLMEDIRGFFTKSES